MHSFWREFIVYSMSRSKNSQDSHNAIIPTDLRRYLSSDMFPWKRNIVGTRVSSFKFSYFTCKETKLVLLSLAIVTLGSWSQTLFRKVQKSLQNVYARFNCLASRPNIYFSDNLSAADIISRHSSRPKGFIY